MVDHEVYPTTDTFGWATVSISETGKPGDSGTVSVTVNGLTMSTPYGANSTSNTIAVSLADVINSTAGSAVTAAVNPAGSSTVRLTAFQPGSAGDVSLSAFATDAGSSSPSFTVAKSGTVLTGGGTGAELQAYYYKLSYTANGNIADANDRYTGNWTYGYDTLNRLTSSLGNGATYPYQCWSYDGFGNRWFELDMTSTNHVTCPASNAPAPNGPAYAAPSGAQYLWASYSGINNQISMNSISHATNTTFTYDLAGNVVYDGMNSYVYDLEGRICAVASSGPHYTQYIYDAEGRRVAEGTLQAMPTPGQTCKAPTAANNFTLTKQFLRTASSNQDTELDGSGNWVHTNIFGDGGLTATYWNNAGTPTLSYNFSDWLGTKRMQATGNNPSMLEEFSKSYPYGNYLSTSGSGGDETEHHFTGKERDAESGLDYFGARYYGSSMGRFSSPDPSGLVFADPTNPQSFNLYGYVQNNPLINIDPNGLDCIYINNDTGAYQGFNRGDCDNSTEDKANTGRYVDGTVDTIYTSTGDRKGVVGGYSGHSDDDPNTLIIGRFDTGISQPVDMFSMSQDDCIQQLAIGVTADSQHSFGCIAQAYKTEAEGLIPSVGVGVPLPGSKRFQGWGASNGTSLASRTLASGSDAIKSEYPGFSAGRYRSPTGGLFSGGKPFEMKTTPNMGRAAGRYVPYIGAAITTAVASWNLGKCL